MQLSIITINYNDPINFDRCITSIIKSMNNIHNIELIIVDDGSKVRLPSFHSSNIHQFYKTRTSTSSRSSARNYGASKAKGKYLLFVDGDGYVDPTFIPKYLDYLSSNDVHFVAGQALNHGIQHNSIDNRLHLCNTELGIPFKQLKLKWYLTYGCNVCISSELFNKGVKWDEQFLGWGVEDIEFAYRVQQHVPDYDLIDIPWHKQSDDYLIDSKQRQSIINLQLAAKKHNTDYIWLMVGLFVVELNTKNCPFFKFYPHFAQAFLALEHQVRIVNP